MKDRITTKKNKNRKNSTSMTFILTCLTIQILIVWVKNHQNISAFDAKEM